MRQHPAPGEFLYDGEVISLWSGPLLPLGSEAPDFSLPDETGKLVRLSDYRGRQPVALIFYVMDETPG